MNELQLCQAEDNQSWTESRNGIIWLLAPDITNALKLTNTTESLKRQYGDEVTKFNQWGLRGETNLATEKGETKLMTPGGKQDFVTVRSLKKKTS